MMIRPRTAASLTWRSIGPLRLRNGPLSRLTCLALGLLVALVAGCSGSSTSPSPAPTPTASPTPTPGFSPTGSMATARVYHTATLLSDGRVLIAGGAAGSPLLALVASAELYDPKTGSFRPTGSMTTARGGQTATALSDGRVLIAGGNDSSTALASAELYDPKTSSFSPTGSLTTFRIYHTATLLADGRVLIAGGIAEEVHMGLASAELYQP